MVAERRAELRRAAGVSEIVILIESFAPLQLPRIILHTDSFFVSE